MLPHWTSKTVSRQLEGLRQSSEKILQRWLSEAKRIAEQHPEYDLHLMMVSTLDSQNHSQDQQDQQKNSQAAEDSLWIWAAPTTLGNDHLRTLLNAFQQLPAFQTSPPRVTLYGAANREWQIIPIKL